MSLGRFPSVFSPVAFSAGALTALALSACQDNGTALNRNATDAASFTHDRDATAGETPDAAAHPSNSDGPPLPMHQAPCNGQVALCALTFGTPLQLMTHVSAASRIAGWRAISQNLTLAEQLRSDVPALELEIFESGGTLQVCEGSCTAGHVQLAVVLAEVREFLAAYSRNTLTLFLKLHVDAAALAEAFADAELDTYSFVPAHDREFPTLGELVGAGARLVVFAETLPVAVPDPAPDPADAGVLDAAMTAATASAAITDADVDAVPSSSISSSTVPSSALPSSAVPSGTVPSSTPSNTGGLDSSMPDVSDAGDCDASTCGPEFTDAGSLQLSVPDAATENWPDWLLPTRHWVKQTNPTPATPGDIDCSTALGEEDAPILILHLHANDPGTGLPNEELAEQVNEPSFLVDRLDRCQLLQRRQPSFISVDFVELGMPQTSVLRLNLGQPVVQELPPTNVRDQ